jgi:hypothetical protein
LYFAGTVNAATASASRYWAGAMLKMTGMISL